MKKSSKVNISLALIHYPVIDKNGEVIASAITNLDVHDIARVSRTYGVNAFYLVTPLEDQKVLAEQLISHWISGTGFKYNPIRSEAIMLVKIVDSLEHAVQQTAELNQAVPKIVSTSAKEIEGCIGHKEFREVIGNGDPCLILFGTAWGLAPEIIGQSDYVLAPIKGNSDYNHLSVRSAVSIILDRLLS